MSPTALFRRFPSLALHFPLQPLCVLPTPVERLARAGPALGIPDLWIKRDDRTHPDHGGNKVRKLEFALGAARARGCRVVITAAATGSNWAAACCFFAGLCGLPVRLLLYERPLTPRGEANLRYVQGAAESVRVVPSVLPVPFLLWHDARRQRARNPYVLPAGGSTPLTSLGYVSAALELAEQVRAGESPAPDVIVAPLGTGGTLGGLWAGLRIAGLPVRLVGVRVVDRIVSNARAVRATARSCFDLILPRTDPIVPDHPVALEVFHDAVGPGYAIPTPEAGEAVKLLAETEGVTLDTTYTGKTIAGLKRMAARGALAGKRVLYWHTLNPVGVHDRTCAEHGGSGG